MSDMLAEGAAWLNSQMKAHTSSEVIYRRGASGMAIRATLGKTDYETKDESGVTAASQTTDFLVSAADMGALVEPQAGDSIVFEGRAYEVTNLASENCWRWSDGFRKVFRIHTRDIGVPV